MTATATIVHTHNHGASGWEIFLWVIAAIATMWVLEDLWDRWRRWQERHADDPIEDASDLSTCGDCEGTGTCRICHGWGGGEDPDVNCGACGGLGICLSCDDAEETDKLREERGGAFVPTTLTRDEANALAARAAERSETR